MVGHRVSVLIAAGGAPWEVDALRVLSAAATRVVVLKRCLDLPDLLATAATGQAQVVVVSGELRGLDADSLARLARVGAGVVVVGPASDPALLTMPAVSGLVGTDVSDALVGAVVDAASSATSDDAIAPTPSEEGPVSQPEPAGASARLVAVWGPTGAPGRTTVATGLAAALAAQGGDTLLLDADAYGGAVAQHLGVLDEVSGLLSAARLANAGRLDVEGLARVAREVAPRFRVLTGLPRPDRWVEVREPAFAALLDTARTLCETVVVDVGFGLDADVDGLMGSRPHRDEMTLASLDRADEVVVVGSADPVGLARLARGLVDLREAVPGPPPHVVVNRVRPGLGWREQEVRAMVEGFVTPAAVHFLPFDLAAADRALVAGRPLTETGDSALRAALDELAAALRDPRDGREPVGRSLRRRGAGTAR